MIIAGGMKKSVQRLVGRCLAAGLLVASAAVQAQLSADKSTYTVEVQLNADKPTWKRCPGGPYVGPSSGLIGHTADPYAWFVSEEFARRFCMPEAMVDRQLRGALAIAARIEPYPYGKSCRRGRDGSSNCTVPDHLVIDVYVDNKTARIPKADPSVEFFVRHVALSTDVLSVALARSERRRLGEVVDAPGERPPFSPYKGSPGNDNQTRFMLLGVRQGWASSLDGYVESYYRANWVEGVDVIRLTGALGYGRFPNPETTRTHPTDPDLDNPMTRFAIGVIKQADQPGGSSNADMKKLAYPAGYLHTIELPAKLVQLMYAFDQKRGEAFFSDIRQRLEAVQPPNVRP